MMYRPHVYSGTRVHTGAAADRYMRDAEAAVDKLKGAVVRRIITSDELLDELRRNLLQRRDVYLSPPNGTWHITHTRGVIVSEWVVRELVQDGKLVRTYSNCADCYCLGPTIDVEATLAARRKHGKKAPLVYI